MTSIINLNVGNGNSRTIVDNSPSSHISFWDAHFSHCIRVDQDEYMIKNELDLMGNPLKKDDMSPQKGNRRRNH
jgi:hypothetical protein